LGLFSVIPTSIADTRILILGDSLSASYGMKQKEGWVSMVQTRFDKRKADIKLLNASISGETTAGGLARFDKVLANHKPDVVIVELGGNDGLRGFPVKKAKQNLLQIIEKSKQKNILTALIQIRIPPNFGPRYTKMFEGMYPKISEQTNVPLMPFFMDQVAVKSELMLPDGIHPNKKAMPIIADFMEKEILKIISK
jgi:acyl-CoA thioesterase-1